MPAITKDLEENVHVELWQLPLCDRCWPFWNHACSTHSVVNLSEVQAEKGYTTKARGG